MQALIGLTVPGGRMELSWVRQYVNVPAWLRYSLLHGASVLLDLMNIDTYMSNGYHIRMVDGRGVRMVYSCMGYGIMSFWAAFALAFAPSIRWGVKWLLLGWLFIWLVNTIRIALLVIATNKDWPMPFQVDHHTWFNLTVYLGIALLMYLYDRQLKKMTELQS